MNSYWLHSKNIKKLCSFIGMSSFLSVIGVTKFYCVSNIVYIVCPKLKLLICFLNALASWNYVENKMWSYRQKLQYFYSKKFLKYISLLNHEENKKIKNKRNHRLLFSSVQLFSMSDSLQPHEPQHARPPCPSPTPGVYPNSCPLSRWCHLTISFSVVPFTCLQSFPTSRYFQMSQLFTSGDQNIEVSASTSVLPMNTQDWFPLGWTSWISLQTIVTVILTLINIHMLTFTTISISS